MGLWQALNRPILGTKLHGGDAFRWREPFLMRLRLHQDWLPRLTMCGAVCLMAAVVFYDIAIGEVQRGAARNVAVGAVLGVVAVGFVLSVAIFMGPESLQSSVRIREKKVTRERHTISYWSSLHVYESWPCEQITIFHVPATALGQPFSVLVMPPTRKGAKPSLIGVPADVDLAAVFEFLTQRGARIIEAPEEADEVRRQQPYGVLAVIGTIVASASVAVGGTYLLDLLPPPGQAARPQPAPVVPAAVAPAAPLPPANLAARGEIFMPPAPPPLPPRLRQEPQVAKMPNDLTAEKPVVVAHPTARTISPAALIPREALALSPDGEHLLLSDFGKVLSWKASQPGMLVEHVLELRHHPPLALAFAPDGTRVASVGFFGAEVWEVDSERTIAHIEWRELPGRVAALSPDGKWLVHAMFQEVVVYDLATGQKRFAGKTGSALKSLSIDQRGAVVYACDGRELASWDLATGRPRSVIQVRRGVLPFDHVALPSAGRGVFARRGGEVMLWDLGREAVSAMFEVQGPVECVAVSADGRAGFGGVGNEIVVWDLGRAAEAGRLPWGKDRLGAMWSSSDGRRLACLARPGVYAKLWDLAPDE